MQEETGVEDIFFSPNDAKWFVDLAYEVLWEDLAKQFDAATISKWKEMTNTQS